MQQITVRDFQFKKTLQEDASELQNGCHSRIKLQNWVDRLDELLT